MEYKDKVVIVTGGAQGIGKCIAEEFRKQGALVEVIDKQEGLDHFVGDLSNKNAIEEFTKLVIEKIRQGRFHREQCPTPDERH